MHYKRLRRNGRLTLKTLEERFWEKVDKTGECWEWTANKMTNGYGLFSATHTTPIGAHRVSYELSIGPIPEGLVIDHLCRNRSCVNPDHLEPVTHRENLMRGKTSHAARNAAKTHCPQGHPYDAANTYVSREGRQCRTCRNTRAKARRRSHP